MDKSEKLIEWLTEAAQRGGEFVEREAPQFAAEVVAWNYWVSIAGLAAGVVLLIVGLCSLRWGLLNCSDEKRVGESYEAARVREGIATGLMFFGSVLAIFSCIPICLHGTQAIKAAVAPRVVIVESLRGK